MEWDEPVKFATHHRIRIGDRVIDYRVVRSKTAIKLRVRVGPEGVDVVQPITRNGEEVPAFLAANGQWLIDQLNRADRLRRLRRPKRRAGGSILFRGESTSVRIVDTPSRAIGNTVRLVDGEIIVLRGAGSRTPVERSLEAWLRREARREVETHLDVITGRIGRRPDRIYVMGQRTKWGNCSSRRNLSFNWRLILAPDYVLRYIVTHEAVHLAILAHSTKFWLTVQSLCGEMGRAKQWISRHHSQMFVDIGGILSERLEDAN